MHTRVITSPRRTRWAAGLLAAAAVAVAFAVAPQTSFAVTSPGPPTVISESATPVGVDGIQLTAVVNTDGGSVRYWFEWGNAKYETPISPQGALMNRPARPEVGAGYVEGEPTIAMTAASSSNQTLTWTLPAAFDEAFFLRWPDELHWLYAAETWRWKRPSPTVTLHYRLAMEYVKPLVGDVSQGSEQIYGPDETITSHSPATAPSVSTGAARSKKCGYFSQETCLSFSGTVNEHEQGYAWYSFEWGTTGAYGYICPLVAITANEPYWFDAKGRTKTIAGDEEPLPSWAPSTSAVHDVTCELESHGYPKSGIAPGASIHYRIVADNGYGSGPVYGKERIITIPGGKPSNGSRKRHGSRHGKHRHGKADRKAGSGKHAHHAGHEKGAQRGRRK